MHCRIQPVTDADTDLDIGDAWNRLLLESKSPETVFQTPGYFDFISEIPNKKNKQIILLIKSLSEEKIIGIIPLRTGQRTLFLQAGNRTIARLRTNTIALLGSIPLTPHRPEVLDSLLHFLYTEFSVEDSIAIQSLPIDSDFYQYLKNSKLVKKSYGMYIKDGWRNCHTTPLPASFSAYLSQLKAKKRYNLQRQVKQLEKNSGPIVLARIQLPEDIPLLMDAIEKMLPPDVQQSMMGEDHYVALARKEILLCYVLTSNDHPCAAIIGIQAQSTFHIHKIIYDWNRSQYSPGTTILHLAIEDLTNRLQINLIDYGYGDPEYSHRSGNTLQQRGHVFLYKKTLRNRLLFATHAAFTATLNGVKRMHGLPQSLRNRTATS